MAPIVKVVLGLGPAAWTGPGALLEDAGPVRATVSGAVGTVTLHNLPAAALLAPNAGRHPEVLVLGLNLGPDLDVTARCPPSCGSRPPAGSAPVPARGPSPASGWSSPRSR